MKRDEKSTTAKRIQLDKELIADLETTDADEIKGGRSSGGVVSKGSGPAGSIVT